MRLAGFLAVALLSAGPLASRAAQAPHEDGDTYCSNCHRGHTAPGAGLTKEAENFGLCQSCHLGRTAFGFDWSAADQAVPGVSGRSHSWSAPASNRGATPPSASSPDVGEVSMAKHLASENLQCSTCHDPHKADALPVRGRGGQHVSPITYAGAGAGTMTLAGGAPASGAAAKQYLVQIVQAGTAVTALFKLSNDGGKSWFGCSAPTVYAPYVATTDPVGAPTTASACRVGPSVPLDDGTNVAVVFGGGSLTVGDRWSFYVSYPFLMADNAGAKMCLTCHRDRDMRWQDCEGGVANGVPGGALTSVVLGTTVFSHPVGQALAKSYDRTVGTNGAILDADGTAQGAGLEQPAVNPSNDLAVGAGGVVTCLSCHHPHNADSNSLTVDPR